MKLLSAFCLLVLLMGNTIGFPALQGCFSRQLRATAPRISALAGGLEVALYLPLPYGMAETVSSDRNIIEHEGQFYRSETFRFALDTLYIQYRPIDATRENLHDVLEQVARRQADPSPQQQALHLLDTLLKKYCPQQSFSFSGQPGASFLPAAGLFAYCRTAPVPPLQAFSPPPEA